MIENIRTFLKDNNLDALLVNSTNEFLVEYNRLEENSRYILTGFSGSTGDAVVTADKIYLFVDGRYHIQADNEVNPKLVTVVKLQTGETILSGLKKLFPEKSVLGLVASKNSQKRIEEFQKYFDVQLLDFDPVEKPFEEPKENIVEALYTGKSSEEKFKFLRSKIGKDDAVLVTNLEEVSYLFNLRDFTTPYSSKIMKRALITADNARLFSRNEFEEYKSAIAQIGGKIYIDKSTINGRDFQLVGNKAEFFEKSPVTWMKAIKTDDEINHYIESFKKTDMAVRAIRDYIENNDNISEWDIAEQLEKEFIHFGAKGLSFKSIVAKDKNSALAHYSKCSKDEILTDGSLVLIDCGAYYEGGLATDITRVFVKGSPTELQRKVYTTVLKVFLNSFNSSPTNGFEIDAKARKIFDENKIDGFIFNHGLGHGIGVSVHEYPPNLSCNELAKVEIEENMCFTIEPGLYNKDFFGVRLENSCYRKDGKIHSFVHMNYEKKLINYDLLSEQEKEWLKDFEVI